MRYVQFVIDNARYIPLAVSGAFALKALIGYARRHKPCVTQDVLMAIYGLVLYETLRRF